jgi:hypothetical protein
MNVFVERTCADHGEVEKRQARSQFAECGAVSAAVGLH